MGNVDIPEVNEYRLEIDRLWDSLEAVFAMAMWDPSSVPKIGSLVTDTTIEVSASHVVYQIFCAF